ncbi:MAG: chemotaxis protein CheX [Rubripirellula sp.]
MITTAEIVEVSENVFSTMVGRSVEQVDDVNDLESQSPVTGAIQISGEWTGAILVQTTEKLAAKSASVMFAIDEQSVSKNDRQDTMAELANMIGGNLKSLLPGPSSLSLPTVTSGKEFDIRIFGTEIENSVPMQCNGQSLRIVVCKAVS